MATNVYPALVAVFDHVRARKLAPTSFEVVEFCATLGRFRHYLQYTNSDRSAYEQVRSRRVAETHRVVYAELNRLLGMLNVPPGDLIRAWRHESAVVQADLEEELQPESEVDVDVHSLPPVSVVTVSCGALKLNLLNMATMSHEHDRWTKAGLAKMAKSSETPPQWLLPLRDLMFDKSDLLGEGAFGAVYRGSWLGTQVVIKFMGYEEDFNAVSTDLILHEVRVWHGLRHPHVLELYGACHVDKRYFVCELISRADLLEFLKPIGNQHLVWPKMYEAALGLQCLHANGVAHNDLKCDNIMVGADGKAKLIDFRLGALVKEAEIHVAIKNIGAVNWRSPEYLAGGRPSFASDVYSFGMCIIEAVSGEIPWENLMIPAQIKHQMKKGNAPKMPVAMTETQRSLVRLMIKSEPSEHVKMSFVVDRLQEIVQSATQP